MVGQMTGTGGSRALSRDNHWNALQRRIPAPDSGGGFRRRIPAADSGGGFRRRIPSATQT
jgi:hypothetical protein